MQNITQYNIINKILTSMITSFKCRISGTMSENESSVKFSCEKTSSIQSRFLYKATSGVETQK